MSIHKPISAERGRPRSFDPEIVLDRATEVFWRHGFQGASLAELTAATGLSKPSLYAAFGDKEALYLRCLDRYTHRLVSTQTTLLEQEPDARRAIESFLVATAKSLADTTLPGGCFVVNGIADCGTQATPMAVEAALRDAANGVELRLITRLKRAEREGQLPGGLDTKRMATLFATVVAGMAVMSKTGGARSQFDDAVAGAMGAWPAESRKDSSRSRKR